MEFPYNLSNFQYKERIFVHVYKVKKFVGKSILHEYTVQILFNNMHSLNDWLIRTSSIFGFPKVQGVLFSPVPRSLKKIIKLY